MKAGRIILVAMTALCAMLAAAPAKAVIYNEATSGDLSNDKGAPTALTLTPGLNAVIGTVNGFGNGDPQDWVSFTIPTGFVMISYVNARYTSSDDQGFTGFAFGSTFPSGTDSEFVAGNYAGFAHFGIEATNPDGTPGVSTVGVNLLPLMADSTFAPGAAGFTPPLGAGTYTFLIQQGDDETTGYRFNMFVRPVAVPEPGSSLCLLAMGSLGILALRRRLS